MSIVVDVGSLSAQASSAQSTAHSREMTYANSISALQAFIADKVDDLTDVGKVSKVKTLDKLSPKEISQMTLAELKEALPEGWKFFENNGRIHIKEGKEYRIKIDPPDKVTKYDHMHIYDENENLLNVNGNIVDRKNPAGHIPWNKN